MRLAELADVFGRLEETRSRSRMVQHVAHLFTEAAGDERAAIVYLLQVRLRPEYEAVETGLGENLLVRAISDAYRVSQASVRRRLRSEGDLGNVAALLAPATRQSRVSMRHAYEILLRVARTAGPGSVGRKIARLAALLRSVSPREAKFIVRLTQGKLRLRLGDALTAGDTVIEGEWDDVIPVLERAEKRLRKKYGRVFMVLTLDDRVGAADRLHESVADVERELHRSVEHH